jgi:hypothetical protein
MRYNGVYSMVRIRWQDAVTSSEPGWTSRDDALGVAEVRPPTMSSIGYVLFENDEWLSITDSIGDDEFGQVTKIPKVMIIEKHILVEKPNEQNNLDFNLDGHY